MSFNDNAQLDTSQVESGGSGGFGGGGGGGFPGGIQVGGGIGGLILLVLMLIFGGGNILGGGDSGSSSGGLPSQQLESDQVAGAGQVDEGAFSQCKTGADANKNDVCLVIATVNSVQDYWEKTLPKYQMNYEMAKTVIYQGQTASGCGTANSQVGPFYCPLDSKVYVDASFFQELQSKFGADGGQLAKEYVVAHEYGHHIQNLMGTMGQVRTQKGPESDAVRLELQADCYAGMWTKYAEDSELMTLDEGDITEALDSAKAVGDDRIQQRSGQGVDPDGWTHGSSEQRMRWFSIGYEEGTLQACDTFSASQL
jgi:predicted metalloprotease